MYRIWMGYKAKNKRSKPYNISLICKYKMKENVCKLIYPMLKHSLKALYIMNTKCHALVMGNRIENLNPRIHIIHFK